MVWTIVGQPNAKRVVCHHWMDLGVHIGVSTFLDAPVCNAHPFFICGDPDVSIFARGAESRDRH